MPFPGVGVEGVSISNFLKLQLNLKFILRLLDDSETFLVIRERVRTWESKVFYPERG